MSIQGFWYWGGGPGANPLWILRDDYFSKNDFQNR